MVMIILCPVSIVNCWCCIENPRVAVRCPCLFPLFHCCRIPWQWVDHLRTLAHSHFFDCYGRCLQRRSLVLAMFRSQLLRLCYFSTTMSQLWCDIHCPFRLEDGWDCTWQKTQWAWQGWWWECRTLRYFWQASLEPYRLVCYLIIFH